MPTTSFWSYNEFGSTRQSNKELSNLIEKGMFQNPKPVKLIKTLIDLFEMTNNDIILDFFSGSATQLTQLCNLMLKMKLLIQYIDIHVFPVITT